MNVLPPFAVVDWFANNALVAIVGLFGLGIIAYALGGFLRAGEPVHAGAMGSRTGSGRMARLAKGNASWQLVLLAATGLILSLASGYTTWKGMTNFTGEAILSAMVTFGIQGVMLIVAWLIGESFAAGMNRRLPDGRPVGRYDATVGMLLAAVVVGVVFYWILYSFGAVSWTERTSIKWGRFADISVYFALGLIVVAVLAFNFSRGGELSVPYVQSSRVIVKNAVLWVMFLACMATSVFFSYDALFTVIFPKEERARAAQLRAQNQVAGIVADIGTTIERRRVEEIDSLFSHKGWRAYEGNLTGLASASQGAQGAIEAFFDRQIENRNRAINEQQNRIASAQSGSAGLKTRKIAITGELSRLKTERPALSGDMAAKKSELDNRARGVDAKRVEAQAESKGAEGTGKVGRGPMYRERMEELRQLEAAYKIQQRRVADAQERFGAVNQQIARLESELATIDGDLAKLSADADTAGARIKLAQGTTAQDALPRIDPARVLPAFVKARTEFRQGPTRERLSLLQQQCSTLRNALDSTPVTKERVRAIDCDPKQAAEASGVMFALNAGIKAFAMTCAGGDKLESHKTTDQLWGFARKCLSDSGLPSRETSELRNKINNAELSRDDRAHPFVATLNAFQDGNKLAYLSLGIAVAMDLLVFMSGLFGANAVRSPLSDVPSMKSRSGRQLDAIIENALLPDTFDTARAVLNAMHPITPQDGFTARVYVNDDDPHAGDVRRVLNAAATIGAVRHRDGHDNVYEVRSELFEFLSVVSKRSFESDANHARLSDLKKVITVALKPEVGDHADVVLHHCRPISEKNGFSSEVYLSGLDSYDTFHVQKALNAGATLNYVQLDDRANEQQRYYVHKDLYKTLLMISAAYPRNPHFADIRQQWTERRAGVPQLTAPERRRPPAVGGDITPVPDAIANDQSPVRQLPNFVGDVARAVASKASGLAAATAALANAPAAQSTPLASQQAPSYADEAMSSRDLEDYFVARLIEGIGLEPNAYLQISGDLFSAAVAAADAFKLVQQTNRVFYGLIDDQEREAQNKLDTIYEHLAKSRQVGFPHGKDALRIAYENVLHNLPIIGLLPGGYVERLLSRIVSELETQNGDSNLTSDEQELLRLVKRLIPRLHANERLSAEDWYRIEAGLKQDHPMASQLAVFAQHGKHSIN